MDPNTPDRGLTKLSPADAELIERLLAGESIGDVMDADQPQRAERASQLLSLLERWEARDAEPGLSGRTLAGVLAAAPVSLSDEDGQALDALLALRRQGLADGPMLTGSRERADRVSGVLALLDRVADEPLPGGLAERTMQAVQHDREEQRRLSIASAMASGDQRLGGGSIRQLATTAALLLMVLSVLLPMLDMGRRDAMIAQCEQNLAGLGADLQQVAFDNKGATYKPDQPETGIFDPLSKFARRGLDGSSIPDSKVNLFVLMDERRVPSAHLTCPAVGPNSPDAQYNGQNPVAGGPFRVFLEARPIFADTNPLYRVTAKGLILNEDAPTLSQSKNHDGVGQNVLISDGSVEWMVRPAIGSDSDTSDNIWLYQPPNNQDGDSDIFLTP